MRPAEFSTVAARVKSVQATAQPVLLSTTPISHPAMQPSFQSFVQPHRGFHFLFTTQLLSPPPPVCDVLHLRFVLPPSVFADPYELDLHASAFSYTLSSHPDLELPVTAVEPTDTVLDVNATLATRLVSIPIHARYGRIRETAGDDFESIYLEHPTAAFICRSPGAYPSMTVAYSVPYVASLGHPVQSLIRDPISNDMVVRIPRGVSSDIKVVELGTFAVVFAAFIYLLSVFIKTAGRLEMIYHNKVE